MTSLDRFAGNLLGAALGAGAIPGVWLAELELREELETLAHDLESPRPEDDEWVRRWTG